MKLVRSQDADLNTRDALGSGPANALSRKFVLKRSWDGYQVPLPFGRAVIRYAPPIYVGSGDDLRAKAEEVRNSLAFITRKADEEAAP